MGFEKEGGLIGGMESRQISPMREELLPQWALVTYYFDIVYLSGHLFLTDLLLTWNSSFSQWLIQTEKRDWYHRMIAYTDL